MESLVRFETVSTIPVTTAFNQSFGSIDVLLDANFVAEEDVDTDNGKDKIDFGT